MVKIFTTNIISRAKVFLYIVLAVFCRQGQAQQTYLFIDSTTIIGRIENNKLYSSETQVEYTLQGNIIFKGDSKNVDNILFTADVKNVFDKKAGIVYLNDTKTVQYIIQKGEFYLGDFPIDRNFEKELILTKMNDSLFLIYNGITNAQIGTIEGKLSTQIQIVAAAHMYIKHFKLDDAIKENLSKNTTQVDTFAEAIIKPYISRGIYYEWSWDGNILKPLWGNRLEDAWQFDGKYIKPLWNTDPKAEWVWDGQLLKPYWDNATQHQWIWNNAILKPYWDSNPDSMWTLEDNIVRPTWNYDTNLQWEIMGNIPLPIIALVILGIADR